jgi:hypothetical protein
MMKRMKYRVTLYAITSISSEEFEIQAYTREDAEEKAIALAKKDGSPVVWDSLDCEENLNEDSIEVSEINEVEEEESA